MKEHKKTKRERKESLKVTSGLPLCLYPLEINDRPRQTGGAANVCRGVGGGKGYNILLQNVKRKGLNDPQLILLER